VFLIPEALKDGASGLVIPKYRKTTHRFESSLPSRRRLDFAHAGELHFDHGSQIMHAEFIRSIFV
jgi:hypothetical protein